MWWKWEITGARNVGLLRATCALPGTVLLFHGRIMFWSFSNHGRHMVDSSAIVNDASYDLCHTSCCDFAWQARYLVMLECHFSWQVQYLVTVMLECDFSWQVQQMVMLQCVTFRCSGDISWCLSVSFPGNHHISTLVTTSHHISPLLTKPHLRWFFTSPPPTHHCHTTSHHQNATTMNGRRLVQTKTSVWASHWLVAVCTFYGL